MFDESTLKQRGNASRSITGLVFFDFGGTSFPEEGWNDFPVIVAAWWLEAIDKLKRGPRENIKFCFMDGPYWITASLGVGNAVLLRCVEDRRGAGVVHEEQVTLASLAAQVNSFAQQVVSACARRGLESSDVTSLRKDSSE